MNSRGGRDHHKDAMAVAMLGGGVPEDVRMTTRFSEGDFLGSLMGTVHETGHGRYEQNLPRDWLGQPVAQARSIRPCQEGSRLALAHSAPVRFEPIVPAR